MKSAIAGEVFSSKSLRVVKVLALQSVTNEEIGNLKKIIQVGMQNGE